MNPMNPQESRLKAIEPNAPAARPLGDESDDGASLREYLGTLIASRWLILAMTVAALIGGVLYVKLVTPIYSSDTLLQVEEKKKGIPGLEDMAAMFPTDSAADTEIEILRSRSLVEQLVEKNSLDVEAHVRYFPIIGAAIARAHRGGGLAAPFFGLSRYGWGGERMTVDRLSVPPDLESENLLLLAGENGRYRVLGPDGEQLVDGEVGKPAAAEGRRIALFVSELQGRPGTQYQLVKRPREEVVRQLQNSLAIGEKGKKTGIIRVELNGPDVPKLVATLDALSDAYVRQNVERKSEEAERTLQFITSQLPELKVRLDKAEEALNAYRSRHGTIDLPLESKAAIEKSVALEKVATELQLQRAEFNQKFTDNHPFLLAVNKKLAEVESERSAMNGRIKRLPESELNSVRLLRDVKVANELYVLLLNKAQELRVVKSGTIGNVRVLDRAFAPRKPVSPRVANSLGMAVMLGLALGILLAFARRALSRGVGDPDVLEAATGLSFYASIPHSATQPQLVRAAKRGEGISALLATRDPTDPAIESLRSLRTSLQFALMDSPNNVVAFSGPRPGIGKSFVSSNFAHVAADSGKRVLLIDGDLRKGSLHRLFGFRREGGLSDVVAGSLRFDDALHRVFDNLHVLTQGQIPPNPSELLMSQRFRELIEGVAKDYDLIVIDTPPILAVTDAAIIGRQAGVTLLVLRAGLHPVREVTQALKRFAQSGVRPAGMVFNDVTGVSSGYGYAYGYGYHYDYRSKAS
jgi:tyrosine-protein kinase Etk/Wzc